MQPTPKTFPRASALLSLILAFAMMLFGATAPTPARAGNGSAGAGLLLLGIVGATAYCASNPSKCGGTSGRSSGGGGSRGPSDAVALTGQTAMWVQEGLQNLGFYQGAIDGAIGAGTRASIRSYQGAIGASQTGVLTGQQVNDLVALSPTFARMAPGDLALFNADLANDLTNDQVRQLQSALNQAGYNAGPVDGAFGGTTRSAIASYKAMSGLPGGPVPTRRLLAYMQGWDAPVPMGVQFARVKPSTSGTMATMNTTAPAPQPVAPQPLAPQPVAQAPAQPATPDYTPAVGLEILGMSLAMLPEQATALMATEMGPDVVWDPAPNGMKLLDGTIGVSAQAVNGAWPSSPAEQIVLLADAAHPELGVVGIFRSIRMPDSVTAETFTSQVLPGIVENYGYDGLMSDGQTWISDPRNRAGGVEACGLVALDMPATATANDALVSNGGALALINSTKADCGDMLHVEFVDGAVEIGLWMSGSFAPASAAPAIKF